MQGTHFWHQLHLHRNKILILTLAILSCLQAGAQGNRWVEKNNPNYDNRKLTYGFLIGLHTTAFQIKYADIAADLQGKYGTLHSVQPKWTQGFSLGFIMNYKTNDYLDLRITPKVAFYEYELTYFYTDNTPPKTPPAVEATMVELPILLKYKSERRGNIRMYAIGGVKPAIQASGVKAEREERLEIKPSNFNLEAGFGFDLYYPLFKFSPEIRFSRGIADILENRQNLFGEPLKRVNTNTITIYFLFQ